MLCNVSDMHSPSDRGLLFCSGSIFCDGCTFCGAGLLFNEVHP